MIKKLLSKEAYLDASLKLCTARRDDLDDVLRLISNVCKADGDTGIAVTPEDLAHEWKYEGVNLERDAFLVEILDKHVDGNEGLLNVRDCHISADGSIHSKARELGADASLLRATEVHRREHVQPSAPDLRGLVRVQTKNKHPHSTKKHK